MSRSEVAEGVLVKRSPEASLGKVVMCSFRFVTWYAAMCLAPILLQAQPATTSITITPQQLSPQLRGYLQQLGDRLSSPGKARAVMTGTLTRYANGAPQKSSVRVITEIQGKARIDDLTAGTSIGSDGARLWAKSGSLSADETALLEVVLNDNMEHFLLWHALGGGSRFFGARFRFDDGTTPNYSGPYYDVFFLPDSVLGQNASRWSAYCVNSDLGLLERVQYRAAGGAALIETVLTAWQMFQGVAFPTSVQHTSGGAPVFSMQFTSVTFSAAVADGTFEP